jgi:hypothetical protein
MPIYTKSLRDLLSALAFCSSPGDQAWQHERRKIHDLLIEGVELALKKRGYPAPAEMKAKRQRKER